MLDISKGNVSSLAHPFHLEVIVHQGHNASLCFELVWLERGGGKEDGPLQDLDHHTVLLGRVNYQKIPKSDYANLRRPTYPGFPRTFPMIALKIMYSTLSRTVGPCTESFKHH